MAVFGRLGGAVRYGMKSWWVLEGPLTGDGGMCEGVSERRHVSLAKALEEYEALPAPKRNALRSWGWSKEVWAPYSGDFVKLREWRFAGRGGGASRRGARDSV